jgi:hypothetical protein
VPCPRILLSQTKPSPSGHWSKLISPAGSAPRNGPGSGLRLLLAHRPRLRPSGRPPGRVMAAQESIGLKRGTVVTACGIGDEPNGPGCPVPKKEPSRPAILTGALRLQSM